METTSSNQAKGTLRHPLFMGGAVFFVLAASYAYLNWDERVAQFFLRQTDPRIEEIAGWVSELGTLIRPELALLIWVIFRKSRRRWAEAGLFFFTAIVAAGIFNVMLKILFGRSRPEMFFEDGTFGFHWLELQAKFWSFPSGHTASSMAAMMALTLLMPRVGPLFLLHAAFVGASRVALMEHYVSDVLVGGVVGAGVTLLLYDLHFRRSLLQAGWWKNRTDSSRSSDGP